LKNVRKRSSLGAALVLVAGGLLTLATSTAASAAPASAPKACSIQPRSGHIAGIVAAVGDCSASSTSTVSPDAIVAHMADRASVASDVANGTPPLLFHGGQVMMTKQTGALTVTPIFWDPSGHPISSTYKDLIEVYLEGVALASGQQNNVFSVANEYSGSNGQIHYNVRIGPVVNDPGALPASGCTVASTDKANIYADGSGYDACLDDAQLQTEINRVTGSFGLPHNLTHIYVLFLPKHVESCFNPGSTTTAANACTINYQPSAAYCAYHSEATSNAVYANMPYPIYLSGTKFTCSTDVNFPGVVESPNGNPDADTEVSPTSHEINEAITDPDTVTGWYDSSGFENGDECAYIFGQTHGAPGKFYNQVIGGFHFLTQEEFSNRDFNLTGGGCVQSASAEAH
jgi:hypothetical protein